MMALEHDLIGVSMTNAAPLVVPTFGRTAVLGTNPISLTAPASKEKPFVLDMATSVVPRGKLEVYDRLKKKMPLGWAVDATGRGTADPPDVLDALSKRLGGESFPLVVKVKNTQATRATGYQQRLMCSAAFQAVQQTV